MKLRTLILVVQAYRLIPPPVRAVYCRAVRRRRPASAEALRLLKLGDVTAFRCGIASWNDDISA